MKTAILTIALALASSLSALAQTVMRENSTVYFKTNVFLHDDPTNALHTRISAEGKEPLWVAASNQVAYYQSGEMTNAIIHARYLHASNAILPGYLPLAGGAMTGDLNMGGQAITNAEVVGYAKYESVTNFAGSGGVKTAILLSYDPASDYSFTLVNNGGYIWGAWKSSFNHEYERPMPLFWSLDGTYAIWQGRVNDTEASRIAALPVSPVTFNSTSWLQSDGTNLFFISTVGTGFTNALTTNTP